MGNSQVVDPELNIPPELRKVEVDHPLVTALKSKKSGNSLQVLAEYTGRKYDIEHNVILDLGGAQILPTQLLRLFDFIDTTIICPYCNYTPIQTELIFIHLINGYKSRHKRLDHKEVIEFFTDLTNGTTEADRKEANRKEAN